MLKFEDYIGIATQAIESIKYPARPGRLYEPIAYTMSLGGKRLRPVLTLMACDAFSGSCKAAVDAAVGIELYHNFTLLHDDVMDKADMRRGKPTVHVKWNDNVAILSGDAMLTMASQYIARTDNEHIKAVTEAFNATAMGVYEGQQYDMDFEARNDVSEDEYIEMIRLKTSVLIGGACKIGALIGNASKEDADSLYNFGEYLGLAFQLQDDWLDVYGTPETFGKEIGGDIMNNKKTFMLINAIAKATGDDALELRRWLMAKAPDKSSKVAAVKAIYDKLGIDKLAENAIQKYNDMALASIEKVNISEEAKQSFREFANMLLHRDK